MSNACSARGLRPLVLFLVAAAAAAATLPPGLAAAGPAWPPSSGLVLAEVMTGGASASDEYVEIANAGPTAADLGGCELVYVTASGATLDSQGQLRRAAAPRARPAPARGQRRGHLRTARRFHVLRRACGGRGSGRASPRRRDRHRRRRVGHGHESVCRGSGRPGSAGEVQPRAFARRIGRATRRTPTTTGPTGSCSRIRSRSRLRQNPRRAPRRRPPPRPPTTVADDAFSPTGTDHATPDPTAAATSTSTLGGSLDPSPTPIPSKSAPAEPTPRRPRSRHVRARVRARGPVLDSDTCSDPSTPQRRDAQPDRRQPLGVVLAREAGPGPGDDSGGPRSATGRPSPCRRRGHR